MRLVAVYASKITVSCLTVRLAKVPHILILVDIQVRVNSKRNLSGGDFTHLFVQHKLYMKMLSNIIF